MTPEQTLMIVYSILGTILTIDGYNQYYKGTRDDKITLTLMLYLLLCIYSVTLYTFKNYFYIF